MGHRHHTDRIDGTMVMQCPNGCMEMEAEVHNSAKPMDELFNQLKTCHKCGAEIDYVVTEQPTEVLD